MSAPLAWLLEVAAAWLMPCRAAATIREQQRDITVLIRVLGYAVTGGGPLARGPAAPLPVRWHRRPRPLAVLAAMLRPGRAVRDLRSQEDAVAWMLDALMAQARKHGST